MDDRKNVNDPGEERAKGEEASSSAEVFTYPALVADCYEGGMWVVHFPDLPGCWYEAASRDEAVRNAEGLLRTYLAYRKEMGLPLPSPGAAGTLEQVGLGEVISVTVDVSGGPKVLGGSA